MRLNIGCGKALMKGFVNLDKIKLSGVDVVHDLNSFPYPFKSSMFSEIVCNHVLEHLDDAVSVMEELHRIGKKGALIRVKVPYFNHHSSFTDPTHKHFFTLDSFNYFTSSGKFNFYSKARFQIIKKRLKGTYIGRFIPSFMRNFVGLFLGNIGEEIYFELKVIK